METKYRKIEDANSDTNEDFPLLGESGVDEFSQANNHTSAVPKGFATMPSSLIN